MITVFNILGSLVIFLYAMKLLGNSLQNVVGERIEGVLRKMTDRTYKGMVVGSVVTFFTQSSSVTMLTLIGLVNVGVLSFSQGIGVVLGSGIGTTITAQLVTFEIGLFYFPIIVIGFGLMTFGKKEQLVSVGKLLFSFGMLFMGMDLMKKGADPLKDSKKALILFGQFSRRPILGVLAGAVMAGLTSSSSATTSLVVALGASGVINLPTGIALILGANIGTCVLELIAIAGMSLTAKRIGVAQTVYNLLGVGIFLPFLGPFSRLMSSSSVNLSRQIANAHTVFNLVCAIFFLVFIKTLISVVKKIVPGKAVRVKRGIKYIDIAMLGTPYIALINVTREIKRTGKMVLTMLGYTKKILIDKQDDLVEIVYNYENQIDFLHEEILRYLTAISEHELNPSSSERLAQLIHGISDIERASDHVNRITERLVIKKKKKINFSDKAKKELVDYLDQCSRMFEKSLKVFVTNKPVTAAKLGEELYRIRVRQADLKKKKFRWKRGEKEVYYQIVYHLERTAHHGETLAQTVISGF